MPAPRPVRLALKAAAGLLIAIAFWRIASIPYNRAIVDAGGWLTDHVANNRATVLEDRADRLRIGHISLGGRMAEIQLTVITGNTVLLIALFATSAWRWRLLARLLLALVCLAAVHVAAVAVVAQANLATLFGAWSEKQYSAVAENLWFIAGQGYDVVGAYAIAFGLWWLLRPSPVDEGEGPPSRKRRDRARPPGHQA